jgi:thiamine pyrophosphate-dependent acetolactate synthase large subunit-like protein
MTGQELETAVRYAPPILVVLPNGMHGTIAMDQECEWDALPVSR